MYNIRTVQHLICFSLFWSLFFYCYTIFYLHQYYKSSQIIFTWWYLKCIKKSRMKGGLYWCIHLPFQALSFLVQIQFSIWPHFSSHRGATSFNISCSAGLVATHSIKLCLPERGLSKSGYEIRGVKFCFILFLQPTPSIFPLHFW